MSRDVVVKLPGRSAPERTESRFPGIRRKLIRQESSLLFVIFLLAAYVESRNSIFLTRGNITNIANESVIYLVPAVGSALLMIGGGLDFSVGSTFTLGGITATWMLVHSVPWPLAVLAGIAMGMIIGLVNHTIIHYLHVPPIIATLGTFYVISGLTVQFTGGNDILPLPRGFQNLGQGSVAGVPYIVLYATAIAFAAWFLLQLTRFGLNIRALGGNRQAAIANRLPATNLDLRLYILSATTASFGGIIYAASVGSGQVEAGGAGTTLTVITGVLIGGVSLLGGLGTITGVIIGTLLLTEINNGLVIANVPPQYNNIVIGTILICAVAVDHMRRERLYRK